MFAQAVKDGPESVRRALRYYDSTPHASPAWAHEIVGLLADNVERDGPATRRAALLALVCGQTQVAQVLATVYQADQLAAAQ